MTPDQFARMLAGADVLAGRTQLPFDLLPEVERERLCVAARKLLAAAVSSAVPAPATDRAAVLPPPALTEEGRLRARVQVLEADADRDRGLAKVGARCMREGHQGLIESGRAVIEGHRFALSVALGLGTGAPWDAIHERVAELRRVADETPQPTQEPHSCPNCEGVDPDTCLMNPNRPADETPQPTPRQWCKCRSCWGWFVEDHPGEDLDELGRDLGWWSGLPEHQDAPAGVAQPDEDA